MSVENVHSYVHFFEECHTRIQTIGELLLIPCKPHPVYTQKGDLATTNDNFVRYRDQVISHLNKMLILSRDVSSHIHCDTLQWKAFQQPVADITSTVVQLTQLSAHIAYLLALNVGGSKPAVLGPVTSRHRLVQADLELKFICIRLKHSDVADLNPHLLVEMCSTVTRCLSSLTEICREAAENILDSNEQDQFKLCIKAITSTTGCLVSSVKSFKHEANANHLQRIVSFCQPVVSTSEALLAFATEEQFLGSPAQLSPESNEIYKSVIGLAMSMVSACVQITKAAHDLFQDQSRLKLKDRVSLCVDSISRAASRLRDLLLSYEFNTVEGASSFHVTKQGDEYDLLRRLSLNGEKSNYSFDGVRNSAREMSNPSPTVGGNSSASSFKASDNSSPSKSTTTKAKRLSLGHQNDSLLSSSSSSASSSSSHREAESELCASRNAFPFASSEASSSSSSSSASSLTSTKSGTLPPVPNSSKDSCPSMKVLL